MRFDLNSIRGIDNKNLRSKVVKDFLNKCTPDDPPLLSDLLADKGSYGGVVIREIGFQEQERMQFFPDDVYKFKIKVIRDEWGKELKPGDKVYHKSMKPNKRLADNDMKANAKRMGTYEKDFLNVRAFEIDKDGCITCRFESAVYFLNNYGIHALTDMPVTNKQELSRNASKDKSGKLTRHIWYWRYKEVNQGSEEFNRPKERQLKQ